MKKLFFTLVALVLTSTLASAQQINLWKNGKCINQIPTANVDSITFSDKAPVKPTTNITIDDLVGTWRIYYSILSLSPTVRWRARVMISKERFLCSKAIRW